MFGDGLLLQTALPPPRWRTQHHPGCAGVIEGTSRSHKPGDAGGRGEGRGGGG